MTKYNHINKFENIAGEYHLNKLLDYHGDGPRKRERRKLFYEQLLDLLVIHGKYTMSYADICKELKTERKSVYRYFENKDDIIIDIAYLTVVYINKKYIAIASEINTLDYDSITKLKLIFRDVANLVIYYKELFEFFQYFDNVIYHLNSNNKTKIRYSTLMTEFKNNNHYLTPILEELRREGKITDKYSNSKLSDVFEQTFGAFVGRTIINLEESERYNLDNINMVIDIMLNGIIIKD